MQYVLFEFLVRVCYVISRNVIGSRLCAYMYVYHMYVSVGIIDLEISQQVVYQGQEEVNYHLHSQTGAPPDQLPLTIQTRFSSPTTPY